jgi:hypothetical protein
LLEQAQAVPETLARLVLEFTANTAAREKTQAALAQWHAPDATEKIAEEILSAIARSAHSGVRAAAPTPRGDGPDGPRNTVERHDFFRHEHNSKTDGERYAKRR